MRLRGQGMPSPGYTLWELLIALAVMAIGLAMTLPGFQRLKLDMDRTAAVNAFVGAVQVARSEAAKRARPVVLCATVDFERCGGGSLRLDHGFMVFVNEDDVRPPSRSSSEPLLRAFAAAPHLTISANREIFEFRPFRQRSTNGTVTFCDRRGAATARAVIVSYTGRPRVSAAGPGRELSCAP